MRIRLKPALEEFQKIRILLNDICGGYCPLDLCLAIEELFVNVVFYSKCKYIDFEVYKDGSIFSVKLEDDGCEFDPTDKPLHEFDQHLTPGGLGVDLAKRLVYTMQYQRKDGINILMLTKAL